MLNKTKPDDNAKFNSKNQMYTNNLNQVSKIHLDKEQNSPAKSVFRVKDFAFNYPFAKAQIKLNGEINIYPQDVVLINGTSGIGKSTLLYALKGLIPHVINGNLSGEIYYNDKDIRHLNSHDLSDIGLLLQNPQAQIITQTVIEELAFGLENLQIPREIILADIEIYAKKFNITHLLDKSTAELSTGEMQQINLISVLITKPRVLLLDEPTAFLDVESATHFIDAFNNLDDTTIIIIEHNLDYLRGKINRYFEINANGMINESSIKQIQWNRPLTTNKTETKSQIKHLNQQSDQQQYPMQNNNIPMEFGATHQILTLKKYKLKNGNYATTDFTLNQGEIIGIIGKNGIGKSTWLQTLAKIKRNNNEIYLHGKNITQIKDYYNHVGLLWQNPENHFLYSTVAQELHCAPELINTMGLNSLLSQNPFTLSEGQKRRLSLAILWSLNREIYLLDEPSFGQDFDNKLLLIQMIQTMQNSGKSFIIISHDFQFLQAICSRIMNFTEQGLIPHE